MQKFIRVIVPFTSKIDCSSFDEQASLHHHPISIVRVHCMSYITCTLQFSKERMESMVKEP